MPTAVHADGESLLERAATTACSLDGRGLIQSIDESEQTPEQAMETLGDVLPKDWLARFNRFAGSAEARALSDLAKRSTASGDYSPEACRALKPLAVLSLTAERFGFYGLALVPGPIAQPKSVIDGIREGCDFALMALPMPPCN